MQLLRNSFLAITFVSCGLYADSDTLSRRQARNYIEHIVDTLFDRANHTRPTKEQIDLFIEKMTSKFLNNSAYYNEYDSTEYAVYDTQSIYDALLKETVNFVKQKAIELTKKELAGRETFQRDSLIESVSKQISKEVSSILYKSHEIKFGALSEYIGSVLKHKVCYLIDQKTKPVVVEQPVKKVYVSEPTKYVYVPSPRRYYVEDVFYVEPVLEPVFPVFKKVRPVYACAPKTYWGLQFNFTI